MSESLVARFATALAIGLIVGAERGWRDRNDPAGSRTAGILLALAVNALMRVVYTAVAGALIYSGWLAAAIRMASVAGASAAVTMFR